MVFGADDVGAWLVAVLGDAGRRKVTEFVLGSDQERALGRVAKAALQAMAREASGGDEAQAQNLALVVGEVFAAAVPGAALVAAGGNAGVAGGRDRRPARGAGRPGGNRRGRIVGHCAGGVGRGAGQAADRSSCRRDRGGWGAGRPAGATGRPAQPRHDASAGRAGQRDDQSARRRRPGPSSLPWPRWQRRHTRRARPGSRRRGGGQHGQRRPGRGGVAGAIFGTSVSA
jgi:hypothetical protein